MKQTKLNIVTKTDNYPIIIGSNLTSNVSKLFKLNSIDFDKCLIVVDRGVPKKFVSNILIIISFIFHLMNKNVGNVNINYYLTDHKKAIDKYVKEGLNYGHINNGSCNNMTNTIDIWRIEEIMKVTIHELFHLFDCDKSMNDDYNIINFYHKRYNINSERELIHLKHIQKYGLIY